MTENVSTEALHKRPWKYVGYRGFCDFVVSDNDFFVLRRFSQLTARVLLALQDELSELEEQLQLLENHLSDPASPDVHNGSLREETSETRLELIREIDKKLRAYNELVIQHSEVRSRPRVPEKDISSISNWFHNYENAIHPPETSYIHSHGDLFAVVPKNKTPLRRLLEQSSHFRLWKLWKKAPKIQDENIHYTSDQRIDFFVGMINTTLGLIMLIVPLWLLAFVGKTVNRLAIITAFLVCFLSLVTFTTIARPFESLGATAA
ncbi:uncharacterized protein BDR25DRAFT_369291 [Lindgomyces ingoldianus]|uniref:Uncharacterized protein n=1 Tax=Lindgomyces ingoldianus TaxID=673940 RepID=A0ACB6QUS3_9PLEO|nr:uncharacterized protein BDR25DRAFT_369291 [Lindgomyces ingoldianus]KAF2470794.1 hypothetical protein BDR25DRAFT_369291 [Lindgomyces ingoldianus]